MLLNFGRNISQLLRSIVYMLVMFSQSIYVNAEVDVGNKDAVNQLSQLLSKFDSYQADFSQVMRDPDCELVDESSGKLVWRKPDKFRWDIASPFEQTMVLDGDQYTQFDRDLDQIIFEKASAESAELPTLLLGGNAAALQWQYAVDEIVAVPSDAMIEGRDKRGDHMHENRNAGSNTRIFKLTPTAQTPVFQQLLLEFRDGSLVAVSFQDELNNSGVFQFKNINTNQPIADEYFVITPPLGAEIIHR